MDAPRGALELTSVWRWRQSHRTPARSSCWARSERALGPSPPRRERRTHATNPPLPPFDVPATRRGGRYGTRRLQVQRRSAPVRQAAATRPAQLDPGFRRSHTGGVHCGAFATREQRGGSLAASHGCFHRLACLCRGAARSWASRHLACLICAVIPLTTALHLLIACATSRETMVSRLDSLRVGGTSNLVYLTAVGGLWLGSRPASHVP